ncbi:YwpF family protein [Bacillus testis]|uniref:YwpF family protein n=1 Tax=Bacillus testis TaxID=1622072 RepID=UPI00067EC18C|nr:YwpF family protein [Bacillus testis]
MKSFKLVSLQIVNSDESLVDIELSEGLIINKEDEQNRWLIEGFIHRNQYPALVDALKGQDRIHVQVVITKKENNPANFDTEVLTIKQVDDYYSVLFEGCIIHSQIEYAEVLLEHLMEKGFSGDTLLEMFKGKIRNRPQLPAFKHK